MKVKGREYQIVVALNGVFVETTEPQHTHCWLTSSGDWSPWKGQANAWPTREFAEQFLSQHADPPAEPSDIVEARKVELPMQPIIRDSDGVLRFKENSLVRYLLDWATQRGCGLNELAIVPASQEDREQLMQLIGYSLSGYGELSFVSDESYERADKAADIFAKG